MSADDESSPKKGKEPAFQKNNPAELFSVFPCKRLRRLQRNIDRFCREQDTVRGSGDSVYGACDGWFGQRAESSNV